jgi:hypothetical protein
MGRGRLRGEYDFASIQEDAGCAKDLLAKLTYTQVQHHGQLVDVHVVQRLEHLFRLVVLLLCLPRAEADGGKLSGCQADCPRREAISRTLGNLVVSSEGFSVNLLTLDLAAS